MVVSDKVKWVCRKSGYVHESKKAFKNCQICGQKAYFVILLS